MCLKQRSDCIANEQSNEQYMRMVNTVHAG